MESEISGHEGEGHLYLGIENKGDHAGRVCKYFERYGIRGISILKCLEFML